MGKPKDGPAAGDAAETEGPATKKPSGIVPGRVVYYTPAPHEPFALREGDPGIVGLILRVEGEDDAEKVNIYLLCDGVEQNTQFVQPIVRGVPYSENGEGGSFRFTR